MNNIMIISGPFIWKSELDKLTIAFFNSQKSVDFMLTQRFYACKYALKSSNHDTIPLQFWQTVNYISE